MMAHWEKMLLEKTVLIFLVGILLWLCPLSCRCLNPTPLDLRGMKASQVSTYESYSAARAIDGNSDTNIYNGRCSHTGIDSHPWWKVDLEGNHCLGRITLVNRGEFNTRLNGAVVRAGVESNIFNNAACGSPVTWDQASIPGAHIPMFCDPPVIAQYVSVDDDDHIDHPNNYVLTLCEVIVEEYPMEDCLQKPIIDVSKAAMVVNPSFSITCKSTLMFVDKRVTNPRPLLIIHMKSIMQCLLGCRNACLSFDYVMTSGLCRLYDEKAGDLKVADQPGCLVYAVVRG